MRATRDGRHISGAERLSDATTAPDIARTLVARALHHPRGIPDDIHVTVRAVHPADIRHLTALPVTVRDTTTPAQAHAEVARLLSPGVLAALLGVVDLPRLLLDLGMTIGQIIGIMAGVGLVLGGLSATGVALSLASDLVGLVGDNVLLLLVAGAVICFLLGMGLTVSAAYVLLAIVLVPGLLSLGVDLFAAHLFVIYWASASYLTPPVALAAFAASGISGARLWDTAVEATRLASVKYLLPFAFVLNPALVAQAGSGQVFLAVILAVVGVPALALGTSRPWWERLFLGAGGLLLLLPPGWFTGVGVALLGVVILRHRVRRASTLAA